MPAEWNFDTLKQHFDALREADKEAVKAALAAAEKAVEKADDNGEKWRENANEWRGAMNDRERNLMPRPEAESRLATQDLLLRELKENDGTLRTDFMKELATLRVDLMKEISGLRESRSQSKGRDSVIAAVIGLLAGAVISYLMLILKRG